MRLEHPFSSWQVQMTTEPLCGGFIPPCPLLRTIALTLVGSAVLYRAPGKSGGFYGGRGLSKQLIEVREEEVRPNDCQMPMNHINKKSDEPKIEVSVLPHFQA